MSQLTNSNPQENEKNKVFESVDDLLEHFSNEVSPVKVFSNSSISNLKQEAKKLKKISDLGHEEALDQVAINRGFASFNKFRKAFEHWKNLPTIYIHISKHETVYHTQDVYTRLPEDDQSKSIKELREDINTSSINRINKSQSFSKPSEPIILLDNLKFGIKLLTEDEKDKFFTSFKYEDSFKLNRINRDEDFFFKFIHYKLDPLHQKKIRDDLEKSSKEYRYSFSESDVRSKITELIDDNLRAYLTKETYTEDTFVYERFDVYPNVYIVNNKYYSTVDLYNPPFDDFGPLSKEDY